MLQKLGEITSNREEKYFKAACDRIKKTKVIDDSYLDTIENNKSNPEYFGSLVELGILKPGTVLFDPKRNLMQKLWLWSIKYKDEGSIHKVAAKIMGTDSYNGWTYWHCKIGNSIVLIDNLRQKFISENI